MLTKHRLKLLGERAQQIMTENLLVSKRQNHLKAV